MNIETDKEYSIPDILLILKKWVWIIALCVVICMLIAYIGTKYVIDEEYTSSAIMYVVPDIDNANPDSQTPLSDLNYAQKIVISYIEVLKTEAFLEDVADQSNLNYTADQLAKIIEFNVINETEFFEIKVITDNPEDSLVLADTTTELAPEMISKINATDSARVVSPAKLPTKPSGPNLMINMAIGLIAGIFLGTILAFVLNKWDKHIKDADDLQDHYKVPFLGHVLLPSHKMEPSLGENPHVISVERYKTILKNLKVEQNLGMKRIVITSPEPNEAKSTNCYNLGIILAKVAAKVLIIDCDYWEVNSENENNQQPSALFTYFKLNQVPGLSEMLTSRSTNKKITYKTEYTNLDIISRGSIPDKPAELLCSSAMKKLLDIVPTQYDYILINAPALNTNPDVLTLSQYIDGVILVVKQGKTTHQALGLALGSLLLNNLKVIGLILESKIQLNLSGGSKHV